MKINKIILAGIMSLALAGCSSSNQQEIDPIDLLDTANETTAASDISETTTVSETISETTTTDEATTTSEITTTEKTVAKVSEEILLDTVDEDEVPVISECLAEFEDNVRQLGGTVLYEYEIDNDVLGVYEKDGNFTFCSRDDINGFQEVYTVEKGTPNYQDLHDYKAMCNRVKEFIDDPEPTVSALTLYSEETGFVYRLSVWHSREDKAYASMDSIVHYTNEGVLSSSFYYHDGEIGVLEYNDVACGVVFDENNNPSLVARILQDEVLDDGALFKDKPITFEECNFHVMPDGNRPEDGFAYETLVNEQLWRHGIDG